MIKAIERLQEVCKTYGNLYDITEKKRNADYYILYMLNRTQSIFEYGGLPENITKKAIETLLQIGGYGGVTEYNGELYALGGGLGGKPDVNYEPTILTVANPALNYSANLEIGKDCVVIKNDSFYAGLYPLLSKYATLLAENDITLYVKDILSRVPFLISAADDRTMKSAEKFLQDIVAGKIGIIGENFVMEDLKVSPTGNLNLNITDSIELHQYLKAGLYNDIGLQCNYNMKRESLNSSETTSDNAVLLPLIDDMLKNRQEGLKKVNEKYGTNITVKLSSAWEDIQEEIKESEENEDVNKQHTTENTVADN